MLLLGFGRSIMGRPRKQEIELTKVERDSLSDLVRSRTAPHGLVRRARIVLASAEGGSNTEIAREVGLSIPAVSHWRKRFLEQGLAGLYGEQRPGRPRSHDDEAVANLLATVLKSRPRVGTHWSVRSAAAACGISKSTVQRYFRLFGVQPHRARSFKLSTDPLFVEKVRDIVGLYLNPPDHAVVLCVDEKSQIQALERTQPMLPMGFGHVDGITHDYKRHGTTTLFAALDVANGQVLAQCRARHRHQEFLAFLKRIDGAVPSDLDVHLVVDNYATHKHPKVRAWLAARPRFHTHYTPTYASWLNQVERWFAILTSREIRRGSFASAKDLVTRISAFVAAYNARSRPFAWTATADHILAKLGRLCNVISGTLH
jgi:putative transposase